MELSSEEKVIFDAIVSARNIQDFLWGFENNQWNLEEWKRMLRKRVEKIDEIDLNKPHSIVEMKKRLLQNAAISINLLNRLNQEKLPVKECSIPSNLEEYKK